MLALRRVTLVLLICALGGYAGVLFGGRQARERVVDANVIGSRLAADGHGAVNTAFNTDNGSAAIGIDNRYDSIVHWTIAPLAAPGQSHRYLYISSDDPEFFSATGSVIVSVDAVPVAIIRAKPTNAEPQFVADPRREAILMPPERTLGYRFSLSGNTCADAPCDVSVHGTRSFWHVNRLAVVGEAPRFVAETVR
jgi:hypothetical protein